MSEDFPKAICKVCLKEKGKKQDLDRRRSDRGFKYINEYGYLWHGKKCPDCHSKSVYQKYEKPRRIKLRIEKKLSEKS